MSRSNQTNKEHEHHKHDMTRLGYADQDTDYCVCYCSLCISLASTSIHICDSPQAVSSLYLGFASRTLPTALASQNVVYGLYPAGGDARQAYAHLIQSGTCQQHTMCSWPQQPDPSQSDTCQPHTMCSYPRRSDLFSDRLNAREVENTPEDMSIASMA
jgi:hypothetical protein